MCVIEAIPLGLVHRTGQRYEIDAKLEFHVCRYKLQLMRENWQIYLESVDQWKHLGGGAFNATVDGVKLHYYDADFKSVPTLQTSAPALEKVLYLRKKL